MALATVADCKAVLRVTTTAEDGLFANYLANALAAIQRAVGVPVTGVSQVMVDRGQRTRLWGGLTTLRCKYPVDTSTITIVDASGTTLASTDFDATTVNEDGLIRAPVGGVFANAPYTITATVGLDKAADWAVAGMPVVNQAIYDLVADYYTRRNPSAATEQDIGVSTTYVQGDGLPPRVRAALNSIAPVLPL